MATLQRLPAASAHAASVKVPPRALVVLCGPAGCGKSTFARRHFLETQIVSSDRCRGMIADDEADQSVNSSAFRLLRLLIALRLRHGRLTVVDSTAVQREHRRSLVRLGREHGVPVLAVLFDVDEQRCLARNRARERRVPEDVIALQRRLFLRSLETIFEEDFDSVSVLGDAAREQVVIAETDAAARPPK